MEKAVITFIIIILNNFTINTKEKRINETKSNEDDRKQRLRKSETVEEVKKCM